MEKEASPADPASAVAVYKKWMDEFELAYDHAVALENLGIAIPVETLAPIRRETEPAFRRINGLYARATATLPLPLRKEEPDDESD